MIEIDAQVVEASKQYLPSIGTAWDDPRLDLRFIDGIEYVKESDDAKYDVILLDGTDPVGPGAVLFDVSFYEGCKRMLKPGGVMALQSESPRLMMDVFASTQSKLRNLFNEVHPYLGPVPLYGTGRVLAVPLSCRAHAHGVRASAQAHPGGRDFALQTVCPRTIWSERTLHGPVHRWPGMRGAVASVAVPSERKTACTVPKRPGTRLDSSVFSGSSLLRFSPAARMDPVRAKTSAMRSPTWRLQRRAVSTPPQSP